MNPALRTLLTVVAVVQALCALGFYVQWAPLTALWPFPNTTPLTFIFIASIFAAAAASQLWVIYGGHAAAVTGIGLDYALIMGPLVIYGLLLGRAYWPFAAQLSGGLAFGIFLIVWGLRQPRPTRVPLPRPLFGIFAFFIIALLIAGGRLVWQIPNTIPWTITPELSVVMGWMFLGAAAYFTWALVRPGWDNAGGQLAGFLAYDVVLIWPFLSRLPTVAPEQRLGLTIYTLVVAGSALVAIYYLFIRPPARAVHSPLPLSAR